MGLEVIGRYRLAPGTRGLEVRRKSAEEVWRIVSATAGITVVVAVVLWLNGSASGNVTAAGLAAACLVALAFFTRLDRTVWHASAGVLSREGFAGRRSEWSADDIDTLEIRQRGRQAPSLDDEFWEVGIRLVDGDRVAPCFSLGSREQAENLAAALSAVLARPVR